MDDRVTDVKMLNLRAVLTVMRTQDILQRIMSGENMRIRCVIVRENNSACSLVVSGRNIATSDIDALTESMRNATKVIRCRRNAGIETLELYFCLMR